MSTFPAGGFSKKVIGERGSNTNGVQLTTSVTANTLGSKAVLITSTESDSDLLVLDFLEADPGVNADYSVNIYIGGLGVEEVLIEGILLYSDSIPKESQFMSFAIPLHIPKGSRITADAQSDTATADLINVQASYYVSTFDSPVGYGVVETIGYLSGTTTSSIVPDAGGTANTFGAWAEISTSTDGYKGFFLSLATNKNDGISIANFEFQIGIGGSGSEEVIAEGMQIQTFDTEEIINQIGYVPVEIPPSTRIAIRSKCDVITDTALAIVFHGVK